MKITRLVVGALKTNCYLISCKKSGETLIVDPGDEAEFIYSKINELDLQAVGIVATHGHFDHVLAVAELAINFQIPFYMSAKDTFLLDRMRSSAKHFSGFDPGPPPKLDFDLDKQALPDLWKNKLTIMSTPGHTPGSLSIYSKEFLVSGDVIFENSGIGRVDFDYCDRRKLTSSIQHLKQLPEETTVYSGHGELFRLGEFEFVPV